MHMACDNDDIYIASVSPINGIRVFFSQITYIFVVPSYALDGFDISVFGDIMVLASPPRPPPVDPDDVNTLNSKNIQPISFKFYIWVDTPLRYFAIEI